MAVLRVPADFETIQAAVDAAAPGDTVRVAGGIYEESVIVEANRDRLAIIGSGPGNTILRGAATGPGFRIRNSSHVTIAGFTVTGFSFGVLVFENSTDNVIRDVVAIDCATGGFAVFPQDVGRNLFLNVVAVNDPISGLGSPSPFTYVIHSEFRDNPGLGLALSGGGLSLGNRISGSRTGLQASGVLETFLIGNDVSGNELGILAEGQLTFGNTVTRNQQSGVASASDIPALWLKNAMNCNQGAGIQFFTGSNFRFIFNEVVNNGLVGIDLNGDTVRSLVDDNRIEENGAAGIRLAPGAADNTIRRNRLKGNNPDIEAPPPSSTSNVFAENKCEASKPPGLCPCGG